MRMHYDRHLLDGAESNLHLYYSFPLKINWMLDEVKPGKVLYSKIHSQHNIDFKKMNKMLFTDLQHTHITDIVSVLPNLSDVSLPKPNGQNIVRIHMKFFEYLGFRKIESIKLNIHVKFVHKLIRIIQELAL